MTFLLEYFALPEEEFILKTLSKKLPGEVFV